MDDRLAGEKIISDFLHVFALIAAFGPFCVARFETTRSRLY